MVECGYCSKALKKEWATRGVIGTEVEYFCDEECRESYRHEVGRTSDRGSYGRRASDHADMR